MSLTEIPLNRPGEAEFESAKAYLDLAAGPAEGDVEVLPEQVDVAFRQPTAGEFQANFEDIMQTLRPPGSAGRQEGRKKAVETYVEDEEVYRLRAQAAMVIDAKKMADLQVKVDRGEVKDPQQLDVEKARLFDYNQLVREVIVSNPGEVYKSNLMDWLGTASGDRKWSEHLVNGVGGEQALAQALNQNGALGRAFLASGEQDRRGMDIVLLLSKSHHHDTYLGVDVKTRRGLLPHEEIKPRQSISLHGAKYERLEVGLDAEYVTDSFALEPAYARQRIDQIADQVADMGYFSPRRTRTA
ncbi:MAG TPA: hypothetical protein VK963_02575 [Candidatus Saccharimonadales bacterium]|nr:hypothetical protein [Candidatus Saccharimonadales bacterium]